MTRLLFAGLLGLALMLIYLAWVQIALFMFMMYFGGRPFTPLEQFLPDLLLTNAGVTLLIAGTLTGAILAAIDVVMMDQGVEIPTDQFPGSPVSQHRQGGGVGEAAATRAIDAENPIADRFQQLLGVFIAL